ncbi:hypothetical protein J6590_064929 [Homalodisca vitripennis]|nr:hypothetical protein J6590_064929 [Homalodisca vitripennis]
MNNPPPLYPQSPSIKPLPFIFLSQCVKLQTRHHYTLRAHASSRCHSYSCHNVLNSRPATTIPSEPKHQAVGIHLLVTMCYTQYPPPLYPQSPSIKPLPFIFLSQYVKLQTHYHYTLRAQASSRCHSSSCHNVLNSRPATTIPSEPKHQAVAIHLLTHHHYTLRAQASSRWHPSSCHNVLHLRPTTTIPSEPKHQAVGIRLLVTMCNTQDPPPLYPQSPSIKPLPFIFLSQCVKLQTRHYYTLRAQASSRWHPSSCHNVLNSRPATTIPSEPKHQAVGIHLLVTMCYTPGPPLLYPQSPNISRL